MTDELAIDRAGWPAGPWDSEGDRYDFRTEPGYPGLIHRNRLGVLCGYVAVPSDHPAYDKYDGLDIEVHGGLTYGGRCRGHICHVPSPGEPDDVYWLGFDCCHCYDLAPSAAKYGSIGGPAAYRDVAYVREQVENLARQLAEIGKAAS